MDAETREFLSQQFGQVREQFGQVREQFGQVNERLDGLRQEMNQRFEQVDQRFEQVDGEIRQTHVLIEHLRSQIETVAEGVVGNTEAIGRLRVELSERSDRLEKDLHLFARVLRKRDDDQEIRIQALEAAA